MKIAFAIKEMGPPLNGPERNLADLVRDLVDRGHEIHLFLHRCRGSIPPGVRLHYVPVVPSSPALRVLTFARNAGQLIGREHFDIVHGFTQIYPQDVHFLGGGIQKHWLVTKHRTPLIRAGMYVIRPVHLAHLHLERKILQPENSKIIIANSSLCRNQLKEYYGVPNERVRVIHHCVDLDRFHPGLRTRFRKEVCRRLEIDPAKTVVLFVANNFSRKGLDPLIESLAQVRGDGWHLMIVGRGNPRPYLKRAKELGVAGRLSFTGLVDGIEAYYGTADLFALPTHYDPFANVCLEAMASGLPVITTCQNGAAEIISNGRNGFILEGPGDLSGLAEAIRILQDRRTREEMGGLAREAAAHLPIDAYTERTLEVYRDVLEGGRQAEPLHHGKRRVEIAAAYRDDVAKMGLDRYATVMAHEGHHFYSDKQSRSVVRIDPPSRDLPVLYLKRHRGGWRWGEVLSELMRGRSPRSRGRREWENAERLQTLGIPTMARVAVGEEWRLGLEKESFFVSAAVEGESLENFLPLRYAPPLTHEQIFEKRVLIRQAADLTRRLHRAGLWHRDYYLGHLFVRRNGEKGLELLIIDLERLVKVFFPLVRRRIKDLASLSFTAEGMPLTRTDRLRFYLRYRRVARLDAREKALIRAILRKAERIGQHTARVLARRIAQAPLSDGDQSSAMGC
ncbi:MAG: glycosyltransferase [Candidatus Methylomirabilales bacterium]